MQDVGWGSSTVHVVHWKSWKSGRDLCSMGEGLRLVLDQATTLSSHVTRVCARLVHGFPVCHPQSCSLLRLWLCFSKQPGTSGSAVWLCDLPGVWHCGVSTVDFSTHGLSVAPVDSITMPNGWKKNVQGFSRKCTAGSYSLNICRCSGCCKQHANVRAGAKEELRERPKWQTPLFKGAYISKSNQQERSYGSTSKKLPAGSTLRLGSRKCDASRLTDDDLEYYY